MYRIGQGIDFHQLALKKNHPKPLILGGIEIESELSIIAHSDGDIIIHSLADAILGALGEADIGEYFPDTIQETKNLDSKIILRKALHKIKEQNYSIVNMDITLITEEPKIKNFREKIKENLASLCNLSKTQIALKATTTEKKGFIGRKEGIGCLAVVLLKKD
ncbi:MAG: 2-C-methyl-D-erythritol 2,4-cyclodiphosphate synthase [Leptonema sp. (in: bacteria)]